MAPRITPALLGQIAAFLADAPEELTLAAVKRSPELARLVILADEIGMRVGRNTLDWLKTDGTACDPVKGEAGPCPMMGANTPPVCPICDMPRGKGCGYSR